MQATLKAFLQRLIKRYEGGWVWDKDDPGGPTNFGVTWRALADHRGEVATTAAEWAPKVKAMSLAEAVAIYEKKYAPPVWYSSLPAGVDTCMLDYAVNSGPGRANRVARRIVGLPDGTSMTSQVVAKIREMGAAPFIEKMCDERLAFMKSLKGGAMWAKYGKGWGTRVADLRAYSRALAIGKVPVPAPDLSTTPTPKAEVQKPGKGGSTAGSGVGGVLTTIVGYLTDLPWMWIGAGVVAVVAVGVAIHVYRDIRAAKAEVKVHI